MESVENEDPVAPQPPQQSAAAKWSGTLVEAGASAIPLHAPDADKQAVYLRYIEELTPSHMRLLEFMNDPPGCCSRHDVAWPGNIMMGGLGPIVDAALPDLAADEPFLDTLAGDLSRPLELTRPATLGGGSAEVEGEYVFAPHDAAGVGEAVAQVERAGRAGAV
jgi:hypothetical protein